MEQDRVSEEFKRKVAKGERAGVVDKMAARIDEVLEKQTASIAALDDRDRRRK